MKKRTDGTLKKSAAAVAWLCADPSRTQIHAALKFGISQGAVSAQKTREDHAISWCLSHPSAVDKICIELTNNPVAGPRALAFACSVSEEDARLALIGIAAQSARNAALIEKPVPVDPVVEMRNKCALVAESVGGEYGATIAEIIRSIPA